MERGEQDKQSMIGVVSPVVCWEAAAVVVVFARGEGGLGEREGARGVFGCSLGFGEEFRVQPDCVAEGGADDCADCAVVDGFEDEGVQGCGAELGQGDCVWLGCRCGGGGGVRHRGSFDAGLRWQETVD